MSDCKDCSIEEKLMYCCSKNPFTEKTHRVKFGNKYYNVCTELNQNAECSVYDHLPRICREYQCYKLLSQPLEVQERNMIRAYQERIFSGLKLQSSKPSKSKK